ncbi:MAG: hypothetical protein RBU37_00545 [Myxococcota bacterium]|jgi:hypothetical protein|nr:hypothetical protein [Myxococcota bacterium]
MTLFSRFLYLFIGGLWLAACSFSADSDTAQIVPCTTGNDCATGICSHEGFCVVELTNAGRLGGPCMPNAQCYPPLQCVERRCVGSDDELHPDELAETLDDVDGDTKPDHDIDLTDDADLSEETDVLDTLDATETGCEAPSVWCDGACVALGTAQHCSACGNRCATDAQCCRSQCRPATQLCDWWDPSFLHRFPLQLTTTTAPVPQDASICLDLPHAELVARSLARADGADLRVVRWSGSAWLLVPWVLDPQSAWNLPNTRLCLRIQETIPPDSTETSYYLYLSNPASSYQRHPYNTVFWDGDDFEDPSNTLLVTTSGNYSVQNLDGELRMVSSNASVSGCAVASISKPLPTLHFVARARVVLYATPKDDSMVRAFCLAQSNNAPTCSPTSWARFATTLGSSLLQHFRVNPSGAQEFFVPEDESWVPLADPNGGPYPLGAPLLIVMESEPSRIRSTMFQADGSTAMQLPWLPHDTLQNTSSNYWLAWGEPFTTLFAVDFAMDWFAVELPLDAPPSVHLNLEQPESFE